jgi:hypothetical protein
MFRSALLELTTRLAEWQHDPARRALRRRVGVVLVFVSFAAAVWFAFKGGDVFGKVATSLLTASIVAGLGYFWFATWSSNRATRELRVAARAYPERLFAAAPRIGVAKNVWGRDQFIKDVASGLQRRFQTGPQVIVGDTGTGKTSFLLGLAEYLAHERDVLPVVLSLHGAEQIDFVKLAKERFRESIDPYLSSPDEAEKLWRWMCRKDRLAVLADDLDRAALGHADIGAAIEAARRQQLPLVVMSRREAVPANLADRPLELPPLELSVDEATALVLKRARKGQTDGARTMVDMHIKSGRMIDNPFYLTVLAQVLRVDSLPPAQPERTEHATRLALMDSWRKSLPGDLSVVEARRQKRNDALAGLGRFAAAHLLEEPTVTSDSEWLGDLVVGQELDVIEVTEEGSYRFVHDVVHAYFAAQVLPFDPDRWKSALAGGVDSARVQLALVLAAARSNDATFCRAVCNALMAKTKGLPDEQRLLRAAAAAEVARAGGSGAGALADRIATHCIEALPGATPITKRAALDQLAALGGKSAVKALWDYAADEDYGVRWRAAHRLVGRCSHATGETPAGADAYRVLDGEIENSLAVAEQCLTQPEDARPDDWDPEILPLKHLAWILPAIRTGAIRGGAHETASAVSGHLTRLLRLNCEGVTNQRGLEASIAQGFKVDAAIEYEDALAGHSRNPEAADESMLEAVRLLATSKFWYSRLNLVQAITLHVVVARGKSEQVATIEAVAERDEHPFVRAAAGLCVKAVEKASQGSPGDARLYVWDDEGVVVGGRPPNLAREAIQLVGDMSVLLNLNETGTVVQREEFGTKQGLPHCIGQSKDRRELFDPHLGCHDDCKFKLCPLHPAPGRSAHREISRAFCRHQRLHARATIAQRWSAEVRPAALSDFWGELERLARH